ncbi:MAG TPA: hypothetical protein VKH37_07490 [Ferruginibacter sp.]|nr:hypothetical protein [Ferruginibacter sp.]
MQRTPLNELSKQDESFLNNMGIAGVLLSLTCLVQHLIFMVDFWVSYLVIGIYIISLIGYIFMLKKAEAVTVLLLISTILIFLVQVYLVLSATFSLILLLLLAYSTITTVLLYSMSFPQKLRVYHLALREEENNWRGIL